MVVKTTQGARSVNSRLLVLVFLLVGCAQSLQMPAQEASQIGHNEVIVVGSVVIKGGKDLLGGKGWALRVEALGRARGSILRAATAWKDFSIDVEREGEEAVFVTRMQAGRYRFTRLTQTGFSNEYADIEVLFTVHPGEPVYIGRLVIEFPKGYIAALTEFSIHVEDAKDQTLATAAETHGDLVRNAVTNLMGGYRSQATQLPQIFENIWYRPKKRGFSLRAFTDKGMLTIGKDALEFTSKKKQLTVPYSSVLEVRWEEVGVDTFNLWAVVRFDAEGSEGLAAFKDGKALGWGGESKLIYVTLKQAFADFSSSTGRPGLSVSIDEQMGPQSFGEPNVPVAGGEDAEIVSAVEAAVSVASKLGFRSDASESAHGRVVVQALWHGRPVTLTMRFFRGAESAQHEDGIYIASSLTRPGDVAASGGGQKIEQLYYSRLSEETARRGLRIYGDPTARP